MEKMPLAKLILSNNISLEVIEIAQQNEYVIIRSKEMPKFAFLMVASGLAGTKWQISFHLPDGTSSECYPVACVCESCGVNKKTKDLIAEACNNSGIRILFVRESGYWRGLGESKTGLTYVIEANRHIEWMERNHNITIIKNATSFIDYRKSNIGIGAEQKILQSEISALIKKLEEFK
jgi:hypothetical protein